MSDDRATASGNRRSEIDEQLLLKEWDFTRFFQGFNEKLDKMKQEHQQEADKRAGQASKSGSNEDRSSSSSERTLKRQEQLARRKHEQQQHHHQKQQQLKPIHRRQESDSKLGNASSAFARAFRRENSDFFPSARHSAYLQKSSDSSRSSIFASGNRRGSEISVAGIVGKKGSALSSGEPVLTDFSLCREGPQRPRREKTESEIVFGSRHEARRYDFGRDKDENARRRSCRPSDATASAVVDDAGTIKSTASTTASEYSPIVTQVSPLGESPASRQPELRDIFASPSRVLPVCLPERDPSYYLILTFFCLLSSPILRPSPERIFEVSVELLVYSCISFIADFCKPFVNIYHEYLVN